MIWHPAAAAVWIGDLLGLALLVSAALTAFRLVIHWSPAEATRAQLRLERYAEAAFIRSRWALVLFGFSSGILLLGICRWFVALVPGAMCGTGVIQSMGADAAPALLFRGVLLWQLLLWNRLETLNRTRPDQPITRLNARILLTSLPVSLLAVGTTHRSLQQVDLHQPVDCCAVVYDQFRTIDAARQTAGLSDSVWLTAFAVLSVLLVATGLGYRYRGAAQRPPKGALPMAVLSGFWIPVAAVTLVKVLAAYHYEVLQHECPWCLFLSEHGWVGYPLFGALAVIAYEASVIGAMAKISRRFAVFSKAAGRRQRAAAGRLLLALFVFLALAALPPLIWRLRYGVWLHG